MSTILRLGWTNPQTGAFGAHPVLGSVLDLNDGVTFTVVTPDGLELPLPPRTLVTAGNIRTQGERATRAIHRHNRQAIARLIVGPMSSYGDLAATARLLIAWVSAPPAVPVTLQYQPPNASSPVYLDVVGCASDIPVDESDWLRLQLEPIELVFVARPGLRGDRVTLQNLAVNPGFEAPSGPGVQVFNDSFATTSAYAVGGGSAPTVASNVLSVPSGTFLTFGSPAWGCFNTWQIRWRWVTGLQATFFLHHPDGNDYLQVFTNGTEFELDHVIGGSNHQLQLQSAVLTSGNWYWFKITQFPSVAGDPPYIGVSLYNDNGAGAVGTQVGGGIGVAAYDAVTALTGTPALLASGATLQVGGAYGDVHTVSLFGPGGWTFNGEQGSATGTSSGAWESAWGNPAATSPATYLGGPVTSFGAARIDLPPGGTTDAAWRLFSGGSPQGSWAIPVAGAGNTFGWSVAAKQTALAGTTACEVYFDEYDANGNYLRNGGFTSVKSATWQSFSGVYTTGANCAYLSMNLHVFDATAGASANATAWFDNVQVWNQTMTGQMAMSYCELRFPQAPAQLIVSGLLGDLPAPAHLAFGSYLSSLPQGGSLSFAIGRRASISANAQLVGPSHGWYSSALSPQSTPVLDPTSYGGWYAQATVTSGWNPRAFSFAPADAPGVYHVLARFLTQQATANLGNVEVRATMQQRLQPWYGAPDSSDQLNIYYAPFAYPMAAANVWTVVDSGQVAVPAFNAGALADPGQTYLTPHTQWADLTAGGSLCSINWQMLLPVDGSLLTGLLNNPSNAPFAVSGKWLWSYFDGLGVNLGISAAWAYSLESAALPNPAHASGGPGTTGSGAINVNSGADPYLTLDPQLQLAGSGGVNQFTAYIADGSGSVLPFAADIQYTPLYLYPR